MTRHAARRSEAETTARSRPSSAEGAASDLLSNADREQLKRDGYVVVQGVLTSDEVARLRGDVLGFFERHGNYSTGGRSQPNAAIVVPEIGWVLTLPRVLAMFRSALESDELMYTNQCDIHQSRLSRWHKDSGGVDNAYFDHAPFDDPSCVVYKTALYLQDHDDGSGLTVRRGSHRTGDHQAGERVDIRTRAGDAILFDVRLTHVGQEPDLVETALWGLCRGDWNSARYLKWKRRYWRARRRGERCSMFFTFGAVNDQTVAFAVNNMKRQLSQSPSGTSLSRSLRRALLDAGVTLAEDNFPF